MIRSHAILEEFFLEFFIEGLREDIKNTIRLLNVFLFSKVVVMARQHKKVVDAMSRRFKGKWGRNSAHNTMSNNYEVKVTGPQGEPMVKL